MTRSLELGSRLVVVVAACTISVAAHAQPAVMPPWPANSYSAVSDRWGNLPTGLEWGRTSAIAVAPDGQSIWVAERCGANDCLDTPDRPMVFHFDLDGNLLHAFGQGLIASPHGMTVDRDGNVWVADGRAVRPTASPDAPAGTATSATVSGMQVLKFSPEGKLLMALGHPGGARAPATYFWQPNDVLIAPNGDIFVVEGHSSVPGSTARILKFDSAGRFLMEWGEMGSADGQFNLPHALAMDSQGRLFVADRGNNRLQIFDQEGGHIATWSQFGRPSGLFIDSNDVLYAADGDSNTNRNPGWRRGVYIGSARTGWVTDFIPDPEPNIDSAGPAAEGVVVDANGAVYTAEVGPQRVRKYVKEPGMAQ